VSVPRLLNIFALLLFIVFVATFFTVLVRLSRIGFTTERHAPIVRNPALTGVENEFARTEFQFLGQNPTSGSLEFNVLAEIDTQSRQFSNFRDGDIIMLRVENMIPTQNRNYDLKGVFSNVASDRWVRINFGELSFDIDDRRDFYPFDGYDLSFNCAFYTRPGWYEPNRVMIRSMSNLILLNPRYGMTDLGRDAFRMRVVRLRIQQFLTATLILVEILFLLYLLTIVDLQELLRKGLGYLVGLFIIREILVTNAPLFPTIIDYGTLFLFCVAFFLMLFKFLGGAEERALITFPRINQINDMNDKPVETTGEDENEEKPEDESSG